MCWMHYGVFGSLFQRTINLADNVSLLHSSRSFSIFSRHIVWGIPFGWSLIFDGQPMDCILTTIRLANLWICLFFVCLFSVSANWINSFLCEDTAYIFSLVVHFFRSHCVCVCSAKQSHNEKRVSDHHEARRQVKIDIGSIINSFSLFFAVTWALLFHILLIYFVSFLLRSSWQIIHSLRGMSTSDEIMCTHTSLNWLCVCRTNFSKSNSQTILVRSHALISLGHDAKIHNWIF